jgi:hypothetical protein
VENPVENFQNGRAKSGRRDGNAISSGALLKGEHEQLKVVLVLFWVSFSLRGQTGLSTENGRD